MSMPDELFCHRVAVGPPTHFLEVKWSRGGVVSLVINQVCWAESGLGLEHHRVTVAGEHLARFAEAFEEARGIIRSVPPSPAALPLDPPSPLSTPPIPEMAFGLARMRERYPSAYAPWSGEDDDRLRVRYLEGASVPQLMAEFGRNAGGIRSRLSKLGLDGVRPPVTEHAKRPGSG